MGLAAVAVGIFYDLQYRTYDCGFFDEFWWGIIDSTLAPAQGKLRFSLGKPRFSLGKSDPDVNNVGEFLFRDMNEYTLNIRRQD